MKTTFPKIHVSCSPSGWRSGRLAAVVTLLSLFVQSQARAGSVSGTTIASIVTNTQVVFVYVAGTLSNSPACHSAAAGNRFVIQQGTSYANAQIAAVMSAQAAGRTVDINGNGACSIWGDTETLDDITVH